jgi:squalene synthase HpnC
MRDGFANELARHGPDGYPASMSLMRARGYCARLARAHYENFSVASALLPRRLVPHFYAVYAYCRWADDLGDETGGGSLALRLLRWWREELLRCYDGMPRHPVMIALRETIREFRIPPQPFLDLLFAFEQDQLIKKYQTYEQLLGYCRYSANPVGHLVLYLCECHDPTRAALSDHVCTGLQLANFWQDVVRDLDKGRIYLPEQDRLRFHVSEEDLHARRYSPGFAGLMALEVRRAWDLFDRGAALVPLMPREVRSDIDLFVQGGRAILRKIERGHYNVLQARPRLSKWDKASLLLRAMWRHLRTTVP